MRRSWRKTGRRKRSNTIGYYEWDLSAVRAEKITSNGLKALIHRSTIQQIQFAILGNSPKCKGRMVYFVDAPQRKDLPNSWQSCRWMTTYNDIVKHCHEQGVFDFDLADTSRFSQTDKIVQGARVYKELSTGRLVYLDNFHKTHYEVFSSRGAHLGEMSLGGKLNQSTADNQKRLDL